MQLLHKPTGIRVACQDTRSLAQNRKIARKRLLERVRPSKSRVKRNAYQTEADFFLIVGSRTKPWVVEGGLTTREADRAGEAAQKEGKEKEDRF